MSATAEEPWALAAGWQRTVGGYRGALRRKPRSGGKPVTVRWVCEHTHPNTDTAQTCACIEKDARWRARSRERSSVGAAPGVHVLTGIARTTIDRIAGKGKHR